MKNRNLLLLTFLLLSSSLVLAQAISESESESIGIKMSEVMQHNDVVFIGESHLNTEHNRILTSILLNDKIKELSPVFATELISAEDDSDFNKYLRGNLEENIVFNWHIQSQIWFRYEEYRNLLRTVKNNSYISCGIDFLPSVMVKTRDEELTIIKNAYTNLPDKIKIKIAEILKATVENALVAPGFESVIREYKMAQNTINCIDRNKANKKMLLHAGAHHGRTLNNYTSNPTDELILNYMLPLTKWMSFLRPDLKIAVIHIGSGIEENSKYEGFSPFNSLLRRASKTFGFSVPTFLATDNFTTDMKSTLTLKADDNNESNTYAYPYFAIADYWIFGKLGIYMEKKYDVK